MKKLLLALMFCLTALAGALETPQTRAACNLWLIRYYYPEGSSTSCGAKYFYCEKPAVSTGCVTPYYQDVHAGCVCP